MKKIKLLIAGATLCLAAGTIAAVQQANSPKSLMEQLINDNIEAMAENEGLPVDVLLAHCHWVEKQQCDVVYGGFIWGCSNMAKN